MNKEGKQLAKVIQWQSLGVGIQNQFLHVWTFNKPEMVSDQTIYCQVLILPSGGGDQSTALQGNGKVKWDHG